MKQFEELKDKVLQIIQKNKKLQDENRTLKLEKEQLLVQKDRLEANVAIGSQNFESLEKEKTAIKGSIEELLKSINSLEDTSKQVRK